MKFKIPKDYSAPEGVKEGEKFQEIATFTFDGSDMQLVAVGEDEIPIAEGKKEKSKPKGAQQSIKEKLASEGEENEDGVSARKM